MIKYCSGKVGKPQGERQGLRINPALARDFCFLRKEERRSLKEIMFSFDFFEVRSSIETKDSTSMLWETQHIGNILQDSLRLFDNKLIKND